MKLRIAMGIIAAGYLVGCATPVDPDADKIYGTPGRIVAMEAAPHRSRAATADAPPVKLYTLRTRIGEELRTHSRRSFKTGDCVILWHGLRTYAPPPTRFNYMSGTLQPYTECVADTGN